MTVKIGVVGAGALGFHHTRILRDVPGAELVGFHDANAARAAKVSSELGVKSFDTLEALLDQVKAVSVVVPTPYHHKVAAPALERGLHVLIEKPIAIDLADGRDVQAIADAVVLCIDVVRDAVGVVVHAVADLAAARSGRRRTAEARAAHTG